MTISGQKTTVNLPAEVLKLTLELDQEDIDALIRDAALAKFKAHLLAAGLDGAEVAHSLEINIYGGSHGETVWSMAVLCVPCQGLSPEQVDFLAPPEPPVATKKLKPKPKVRPTGRDPNRHKAADAAPERAKDREQTDG